MGIAHRAFRYAGFLLLCCGLHGQDGAHSSCLTLSREGEDALLQSVRSISNLTAGAPLTLAASILDEKTCYRRLQFVSSDPYSRVTLFLSPDQRFLAPQIFNVLIDLPQQKRENEVRIKSEIDHYLSARMPPALGPSNAPVTIAVFADFQCPYCARGLRTLMKDVLPQYRDAVRVAYLNFPLPGHPWARNAAEAMACIGALSPDMFWRLHDYLFDHQSEIKPNNLDAKIAEQMRLAKDPGFAEPDFHACLDGKRGAALVDGDLEVGWTHDVSATPTLYINGERLEGATSAAALKAVIDRQLTLAAEPPER